MLKIACYYFSLIFTEAVNQLLRFILFATHTSVWQQLFSPFWSRRSRSHKTEVLCKTIPLLFPACFEHDIDIPHNDVKLIVDVATIMDCEAHCDNEAVCNHFVYLTATHPSFPRACYLKTRAENRVDVANYVTGHKMCP